MWMEIVPQNNGVEHFFIFYNYENKCYWSLVILVNCSLFSNYSWLRSVYDWPCIHHFDVLPFFHPATPPCPLSLLSSSGGLPRRYDRELACSYSGRGCLDFTGPHCVGCLFHWKKAKPGHWLWALLNYLHYAEAITSVIWIIVDLIWLIYCAEFT